MLVPPPIASFLVIRFANLDRQKHSALGRYVARYMTRVMEAVRLLGMVAMAVGAWRNSPTIMVAGLFIILFGCMRGFVFRGKV